MGAPPRAIIIDRNRAVGRRVARVLVGAGFETEVREPGEALPLDGAVPLLLVAEAEAEAPLRAALGRLGTRGAGVVYGAGELDAAALLGEPSLCAVLGCRGAGSGRLDLEPELLGLARHLRGAPLPPLQGLLGWGAQAFTAEIHDVAGREAAVSRVVELCADRLGAPRRIAAAAGEVVHELVTNAMYDAPIDVAGSLRYNRDRTAPIELPPEDCVQFRFGTDGVRLAIEAEDRFGRLRREDLCASLRRGAAGQVNQAEGGAGIGLFRVVRACQTLIVDVEPGRRSRLLGLLEIEPPRQAEGAPRPGRSLVFPLRPQGARGQAA